MSRYHAAAFATFFFVCAVVAPLAAQGVPSQGVRRAIVELRLPTGPHIPEGQARNAAAIALQRRAIADAGVRVAASVRRGGGRLIRRYQTVPLLAIEVSASALDSLRGSPDVLRVMDDDIVHPVLAESVPLIEGDQAWASGYDGAGMTVAILDAGVDSAHPFLSGKVVEEACYSSTVPAESQTVCPNGLEEQIGPGAAAPCQLDTCNHGTHVAGIAAGNGAGAGVPFSGVAKNAQIMAVQVFSEIIDPLSCGGIAPCLGGYESDVIAGLERVYTVAGQRQITSVNMSLGSGSFSAPCDSEPYKPIIDNLRSIGIATVVASGNSGSWSSMSSPACISSAVSVGSIDKDGQISWFSNVASFLSLLAPGGSIVSSVPGGGFETMSGTSMATPHVTGAWAVMRQAAPNASVAAILSALQQTGQPVTDTRFFGSVTTPRIRLLRALGTLAPITSPAPAASSVSPARLRAGNVAATVTVIGSGFNYLSVMQWNGEPRPTTVISSTKLQGIVSAADLTSVGSGQVSVATPAPGGGTSASLTVYIDPPPSLTTNASLVAPGTPVTVTLANGFGGGRDWLALAASGAADSSYVAWTYVGSGVTDRTWTVTMPSAAGAYEFRLFRDNGSVRAATSPLVTVDPNVNALPIANSLSPANAVVGGPDFVLTVNGSKFISSSTITWNGAVRPTTFVSASQLKASISAGDIATLGTALVAVVTPEPGGGTSPVLTFKICPPPAIAVSATSVAGGANVTATLSNGLGGAGDWLALAPTGSSNMTYLKYVYVGTGVTERTWTVAMPLTGGTYEFRLLVNGYTRVATSPTVTVAPAPNPVPTLTSTTPSSTMIGAGGFSLIVKGSGFASSSVVRWNGGDRATTFVSSSELRAVILAADVAAAGAAQVTVFSPAPGGGVSSALPFTIGVSNAVLSVSATSVAGGASVTVTLTNGFGGSSDWLALAATSAPNVSYLRWTYVGTGVTTRTWTVTMPTTPGTYEFRLFLNNGTTRAATSPPVTVSTQ